MCYVYNEWYDISCATLYFEIIVYISVKCCLYQSYGSYMRCYE